MKRTACIPVSIMGVTSVVRGNKITFNNGMIHESLEYVEKKEWLYESGDNIAVLIDEHEMDLILIGWYTQFDTTVGLCTIHIQSTKGLDITYKN